MKKDHALGAGVVAVALSATAALAASPHAPSPTVANDQQPTDNHGAAVSAVARDDTAVGGDHDNHGGAVSVVARGTHGPQVSVGAPTVADPALAPTDNHGAAVSAVAKDHTAVGGKNNNHGGAVSAVAHGSSGPNEHSNGHANGHATHD